MLSCAAHGKEAPDRDPFQGVSSAAEVSAQHVFVEPTGLSEDEEENDDGDDGGEAGCDCVWPNRGGGQEIRAQEIRAHRKLEETHKLVEEDAVHTMI